MKQTVHNPPYPRRCGDAAVGIRGLYHLATYIAIPELAAAAGSLLAKVIEAVNYEKKSPRVPVFDSGS